MEPVIQNVFKWSAFVAGIGYGYTHRNTLAVKKKKKEQQELYKRKEDVIHKARIEYAKLYAPSLLKANSLDLNDPNFDLEAYLNRLEEENLH
ncbi:hypothetical protein T552_01294 [Pneumocystis carinii B80]|uniref:ATP synthase F(0) complex subunit e, mitochondrial n=1 Tax=Pneumocystis carinii (strain B80) TaxID=1408658 RepID=A0A0W4ZLU3_PNEC8|nr:hypothetical protein T552_01294 [Pneumocystis carinii B80]KTW29339.1 hypothetical protein T552_01294 [Pneumocystis carinii B80]